MFHFPLRQRDPDYDFVGYITPEKPEDREKFYEFFKPYFEYKYVDKCNLEHKINDLEERLSNAPDRSKLLKREHGRFDELSKIGRGTGQSYYEYGFNATSDGRRFDFNTLDEYTHYWRLLEGETSCLYLAHLSRCIEGKEIVVQKVEDESSWTIAQRHYFLTILGLDKLESFRTLSTKNQHKLLSIILKTDSRTIRGIINNESKYSLDKEKKDKVDRYYTDFIESIK
jgi:hypothetical protein